MFPLFETIKVVDNSLLNIDYHNARVNFSRKSLLNSKDQWDLSQLIKLPLLQPSTIYKCRFVYNANVIDVEFLPYAVKRLQTLKLVECPHLNYPFKYRDRKALDEIMQQNRQFDDVIIVKNGMITDCSFANMVFFDGAKWVTPCTPLLKGTKRQKYIDEGMILEREISVSDLKCFTNARIINAMVDLEECADISMNNIANL